MRPIKAHEWFRDDILAALRAAAGSLDGVIHKRLPTTLARRPA